MSIGGVNKAEEEEQEHITLSNPTSPGIDLELWFALPKQPVGGGQASHPGPENLSNISTYSQSYNFHINPEARFGGMGSRVNLGYESSSVYAQQTQMSSRQWIDVGKQMKVNMSSQWMFCPHLKQDLQR